ncbi:MAG: hypothetical protein AAF355_04225 [Myxococcota bacterium]
MIDASISLAAKEPTGRTWERYLGVLLSIWLFGSNPAPSAAQDQQEETPSPADFSTAEDHVSTEMNDSARRAFAVALRAAQEERWADAEAGFRRSYALSGARVALFNRAMALRAMGRDLEAHDAFVDVLEEHGLEDEAARAWTENAIVELKARIATLILEDLASEVRFRIVVDGSDVLDPGQRPIPIRLNAGRHSVLVRADGYEPFIWSGSVPGGNVQSLHVRMQALSPEQVVDLEQAVGSAPSGSSGPDVTAALLLVDEDEKRPTYRNPWLWGTVGTVVLAGIAVGLWLGLRDTDDDGTMPLAPGPTL